MLHQIKLNTEYSGRLRSLFFKRLPEVVTVFRDKQKILEFDPDNTLTGVTVVIGKQPTGTITIAGNCEGWIEIADAQAEDVFDSPVHFPAFTPESEYV